MFNDIRKAIIAENLFVQLINQRNYPISEKFILGKRVEALNIYTNLQTELEFLENYYKKSGECTVVLDPSTKLTNIRQKLIDHGYSENKNYDEIWLYIDLPLTKEIENNSHIKISEMSDYEYLEMELRNTPLSSWLDKFGNRLKIKIPDLTFKQYIAKIDDKVVGVAAVAFYKDIAVFKGAEVLEKFRRKGIHTQLLQKRLKDAYAAGCKWALYNTSSNNIASTGAGHKLGFKEAFRREAFSKKL